MLINWLKDAFKPLPNPLVPPSSPNPALTPDELAAQDMLRDYHFSRKAMEKDGVLKDYEALKIDPEREALWCREYAGECVNALTRTPEALDIVFALAAEYGEDQLFNLAMETLDNAFSEYEITDADALTRCERAADALGQGSFDAPAMQACKDALDEQVNRLKIRTNENELSWKDKDRFDKLEGYLKQ